MKSFFHILRSTWCRILKIVFYPGVEISSSVTFWEYVFPQRILGLNGSRKCKWPVHYTSVVVCPERIKIAGACTAPGRSPNCYIQAINGIELGANIYMAPGVALISANHQVNDLAKHQFLGPLKIGANCWIGTHVTILPGVELGEHCIVGAGAVVSKSFPSHSVLAGVPAKVIGVVGHGRCELNAQDVYNAELCDGVCLRKDDARFDALGNLDELMAHLGLLRAFTKDVFLRDIQEELIAVSSDIAGYEKKYSSQRSNAFIDRLQNKIDDMSRRGIKTGHWTFPGGTVVESEFHVARTICRRSERSLVAMGASVPVVRFVDRLSTYLFESARGLAE